MSDAVGPFLQMALNNAWANATLSKTLSVMSDDQFTAERPGFFPALNLTLDHIYEVDLYYLDALEQGGRGLTVFERTTFTKPQALSAAQADADQRLIRFCRALSGSVVVQMRITDRPDGPVEERVDALLLHLFQHQIHHRGQAHVQIEHAGVAPPQLDEFHLQFDRAPSASAFR